MRTTPLRLGWLVGIYVAQVLPARAQQAPSASLTLREVALPAGTGSGSFDYIAYEPGKERILVPNARDVGSLDVFSIAAGQFTRVGGFTTTVEARDGKPRTLGPSAVSVSQSSIYVGNRATREVCVIDADTLKRSSCVKLPLPIDGIAYVSTTREVWVTAPGDRALLILDASQGNSLTVKSTIKLLGEPEGYAVDTVHGVFYTNLEDKDQTLQIDIRSHTVNATWSAGCGADGPRGIALDVPRDFVFVACTEQVRVLNAADHGLLKSHLATGTGVDNIDYLQSQHRLYVAAGRAASLFELQVDDAGQLRLWATHTTKDHARNAVADASGNAYLVDPHDMRLLILEVAKRDATASRSRLH